MSKPGEVPVLSYQDAGGVLLTRMSMEQQLRDKMPSVHDRRLFAINPLGLASNVAFDMKAITITHWILDQMIKQGSIQGDQIGVSSDLGADDHSEQFKQFGQRLALFIENGWAVSPAKGEGLDMSKIPGAPPVAAPPNGQPAAVFHPPAPSVPGAAPPVAAPPFPAATAAAPPTYAAPPVGAPPVAAAPAFVPTGYPGQPAPVAAPPGLAPTSASPVAAPPTYAAPPSPPTATPATPAATDASDPGPPPVKADAQRVWGKASPTRTAGQARPRRTKEEQVEDTAYKDWKDACKKAGHKPDDVEARYATAAGVPAAAPPPPVAAPPAPTTAAAPPPVAALPAPPAAPPVGAAPPNPVTMMGASPPAAAPPVAAPPVAPVDQASPNNIPALLQEILHNQRVMDAAVAQVLRNTYNKPGPATCIAVCQDLNIPVPQ